MSLIRLLKDMKEPESIKKVRHRVPDGHDKD